MLACTVAFLFLSPSNLEIGNIGNFPLIPSPTYSAVSLGSPFTHEALLQHSILGPGRALPHEASLRIDPGKQRDPGQGGVLPVGQALLEGAAQL